MYALLDRVFRMVVKKGTLLVTSPAGRPFIYGDGTGQPVSVRITSERAARRIAIDPDLAIGEAYMDGGMVVEHGTIYDVLAVLMLNAGVVTDYPPIARLAYKM